MALPPCVKAIICTLSKAALTVIDSGVQAAMDAIQVQVEEVRAKLLVLGVIQAPLDIAEVAAREALASVEATAQLLPVGLIAGCVGLGDLNQRLELVVDPVVAELEETLDLIRRYTAVAAFFQGLLDLLEESFNLLGEFRLIIAECQGVPPPTLPTLPEAT